jgi:predicted nucleotidyltransferase
MNRLLLPLQTKLLTSQIADLQACYGVNEGLENRICDCARQAADWTSLVKAVTTKRYPSSRIARTLMYLLLGLSSAEIAAFTGQGPLYARLLAASPRGKEMLHSIKIHSSIPLLTKTSQYLTSQKRCQNPADLPPLAAMLRYDTLATDLRALTCPAGTARNDFQQSPLFLA